MHIVLIQQPFQLAATLINLTVDLHICGNVDDGEELHMWGDKWMLWSRDARSTYDDDVLIYHAIVPFRVLRAGIHPNDESGRRLVQQWQ